MSDFVAGVDWGTVFAGGSTVGLLIVGFKLFANASSYAVRTYKDAGQFDAERIDKLETQVRNLSSQLAKLEAQYRSERKGKHDWRSLAASLHAERRTIEDLATAHDCHEVLALIHRLNDLRANNPLLVDIVTLTEGDTY